MMGIEGVTLHSRGMNSARALQIVSLQVGGRRECRALATPIAPCGEKTEVHTSDSHYRRSRTIGTPCAMALRLAPRSPRGTGLVSPRRLRVRLRKLDSSVGESGPHGLTVRDRAARLAAQPRPSHPAPTSSDDRETPLL
jgi:hypothetical protein